MDLIQLCIVPALHQDSLGVKEYMNHKLILKWRITSNLWGCILHNNDPEQTGKK